MKKSINIIFILIILLNILTINIYANNLILVKITIEEKENKQDTSFFAHEIRIYEVNKNLIKTNNNEELLLDVLDKMSCDELDRQLSNKFGKYIFNYPVPKTINLKLKPNTKYYVRGVGTEHNLLESMVFNPSEINSIKLKWKHSYKGVILKNRISFSGSKELKTIPGAIFSLYKYGNIEGKNYNIGNGKKLEGTYVTDINGKIFIKTKINGDYYLVEEEAPGSSVLLNPEVANNPNYKLKFSVRGGKILLPKDSILTAVYLQRDLAEYDLPLFEPKELEDDSNHIVINYNEPSITKIFDFKDKKQEYNTSIKIELPWNLDSYNSFKININASNNSNIIYDSFTFEGQINKHIDKTLYDITENIDGGFTIKLKNKTLNKMAGEILNIKYITKLKDIYNNKIIHNVELDYINPFNKHKVVTDSEVLKINKQKFVNISSLTEKRLSGLEFKIRNKNDKWFSLKNDIISWKDSEEDASLFVSNLIGEFTVQKLLPGKYYLIQTKTSKNYIKKEEPIEFVIKDKNNANKIKPIIIKNSLIKDKNSIRSSNNLNFKINIIICLIAFALVLLMFFTKEADNKKMGKTKNIIYKFLSYALLIIMFIIFSYKFYNIHFVQRKINNEVIEGLREYNREVNKNGEYSVIDTDVESIGVLYIPKINTTLPIFNKANDKTILMGAGMTTEINEKLPVIMSHNGLSDKILFSNLSKVHIKDNFYIQDNLGKVKEYKIVREDTIKEEDTINYIKNYKTKDNEDSVILLTCVPVYVNTHRLLLKGDFQRYITLNDINSSPIVLSDQEIFYAINILASIFLLIFFAVKDIK